MRVLLVANTLPPHRPLGRRRAGAPARGRSRAPRAARSRVLGRGRGGARGPKLLFPLDGARDPAVARSASSDPDVVQVHESDGGLAAALVRRSSARRSPRPLLVALQQVSYVEERRGGAAAALTPGRVLGRPGGVERRFRWLKAPLQILLGRLSARLADLVLAPSRATARELARDYGARRVAVLPNVTGGLASSASRCRGSEPARGLSAVRRPAAHPQGASRWRSRRSRDCATRGGRRAC